MIKLNIFFIASAMLLGILIYFLIVDPTSFHVITLALGLGLNIFLGIQKNKNS